MVSHPHSSQPSARVAIFHTLIELVGIGDSDIRKPMRGNLRRVALEKVLDSRAAVSQKWIAQKLNMKNAANVSQQVRRSRSCRKSTYLLRSEHGSKVSRFVDRLPFP